LVISARAAARRHPLDVQRCGSPHYISGATSQLREDLGPEFEDLREPLADLQKLRGMTPRAALTKHLLDGDDSIFTGKFDTPKQPPAPPAQPPAPPARTPFDKDAT
jgi:sec-independent protein translocase protein TatB